MRALLLAAAALLAGFQSGIAAAAPSGHYTGVGTDVCIYAASGFNSSFEPNNPAEAQIVSSSTYWTADFQTDLPGSGSFSVSAVSVQGQPSAAAGSFTFGGQFFLVPQGPHNGSIDVELNVSSFPGDSGLFTSGPSNGIGFFVNGLGLNYFVHSDHRIDLITLQPAAESVNVGGRVNPLLGIVGGEWIPRVCHRKAILKR